MSNENPNWAQRYEAVRPEYEGFDRRLHELLITLLRRDGLDVVNVEHRVKTVESFVGKVTGRGKKYDHPLAEVTDLVGLRVVTFYLEDVAAVGDLLRREFAVDSVNSVEKMSELEPDRFGYISTHYIIAVGEPRAELPEWAPYVDMKAEVQVRTALQHAWAAVDHKLAYKSVRAAPADLRRRLSRLSALFELADEQFSLLRDARQRVEEDY
ncbi:MAG TPA: hypothetical protein VF587_06930, partial [Solirubrobacteraceae bacterium]